MTFPQALKVSSQFCPGSWDPTLKTDLGDFSAELQIVSLTHATDAVTTQLHPSLKASSVHSFKVSFWSCLGCLHSNEIVKYFPQFS